MKSKTPLRVLIVDDHEDTRELLAFVLEKHGHLVTAAADGAHAIDLLGEQTFDVAVIDIGLPRINGHEVARRAHALLKDKTPYLVAVTGYASPDDRQASKVAGFDEHLVKPVDFTLFASTISRLERR